jgi:hypothetical protein
MIAESGAANSLETPDELGGGQLALARRWKIELSLAQKRENSWQKKAREVYKTYTPENPRRNTFNVLWTNTETLRQSVYNSIPQPQCKRRYSDEDPLGFQVAKVLNRALEYTMDCSNFDATAQQLVLSMLLPGRAVGWVRYVPTIGTIPGEDVSEQISWEKVEIEQVQYDDFLILCSAKTWDQVESGGAIARRHRLTRKDLIERFGEDIGNRIKLDNTKEDSINESKDSDLFKTAEVWEIWDKDTKGVIFITNSLDIPCMVKDDPLELEGFFPTPRPLYAIENNTTLEPTPLYTQYEQQAKELNRISERINVLVDGLKLRGIYDSTISELNSLLEMGDNQLIPAQQVTALIERGGLEKAIWMMPIDVAAAVLKQLYEQREATKNVIYEITGISDIMRAATDPKETFGAQRIKTTWGTQRLQRMQREVQRYLRDLMRLMAEVISEKFQPETLEAMTMAKLPHRQEVEMQRQQMFMQYQQAVMMAQQSGQQPPPPPQIPPPPVTWEDVIEQLRSDLLRNYRIDIETDSTIVATQESDVTGLREVIGGLTEMINGLGPAVQSGAIPVDVVKELIGVVVRRARMGTAVEDVIQKITQPAPQPNPEVMKLEAEQKKQEMLAQQKQQEMQMQLQHNAQVEQMKMQVQIAKEQAQAQGDAAKEQYRMQADAEIEQVRNQMKLAEQEAKLRAEYLIAEAERNNQIQISALEQQNADNAEARKLELERWKAELDSATKLSIAKLNAKVTLASKDPSAEVEITTEAEDEAANKKKEEHFSLLVDMHGKTLEALNAMTTQMAKPKRIVRDQNGKAQGLE